MMTLLTLALLATVAALANGQAPAPAPEATAPGTVAGVSFATQRTDSIPLAAAFCEETLAYIEYAYKFTANWTQVFPNHGSNRDVFCLTIPPQPLGSNNMTATAGFLPYGYSVGELVAAGILNPALLNPATDTLSLFDQLLATARVVEGRDGAYYATTLVNASAFPPFSDAHLLGKVIYGKEPTTEGQHVACSCVAMETPCSICNGNYGVPEPAPEAAPSNTPSPSINPFVRAGSSDAAAAPAPAAATGGRRRLSDGTAR